MPIRLSTKTSFLSLEVPLKTPTSLEFETTLTPSKPWKIVAIVPIAIKVTETAPITPTIIVTVETTRTTTIRIVEITTMVTIETQTLVIDLATAETTITTMEITTTASAMKTLVHSQDTAIILGVIVATITSEAITTTIGTTITTTTYRRNNKSNHNQAQSSGQTNGQSNSNGSNSVTPTPNTQFQFQGNNQGSSNYFSGSDYCQPCDPTPNFFDNPDCFFSNDELEPEQYDNVADDTTNPNRTSNTVIHDKEEDKVHKVPSTLALSRQINEKKENTSFVAFSITAVHTS